MAEDDFESDQGFQEETAPAWVVTFGDLMSLLLCFFVLLLSFSEVDRAKYKEIAGSLANAFGIQRKTPAFDSPKGQKIIAKNFDTEPNVSPKPEAVGMVIEKEVEENFKSIKELIEVEVDEGQVVIRLMGETTFDSGKAEIKPEMIPLLKRIAQVLAGTEGDVTIAGHTDNVPVSGPKYRSNTELSVARALAVTEYFMDQKLLLPERMGTTGYGMYRPIASNESPEGRKKNRRVEIILSNLPNQASTGSPLKGEVR